MIFRNNGIQDTDANKQNTNSNKTRVTQYTARKYAGERTSHHLDPVRWRPDGTGPLRKVPSTNNAKSDPLAVVTPQPKQLF